jgi:thiol-disulfide isomerase/thioredoxin
MSGLDRRSVVAALASLIFSDISIAEDAKSPIARGVLAQNPLAQAFEPAPAELPNVELWGSRGTRDIQTLKGRTILMPLWAEWCAPCLEEIPDFARLQQKYGNERFAIVPVLTGPVKKVTPEIVGQIFDYLHANAFEPLLENNRGSRLMEALTRRSGRFEIPCNVLIAPDGRVVAREFGLKSNGEFEPPSEGTAAAKKSTMLAHAEAGDSLSLWGKQAGEQFAQAMANGFLP